MNKNFEQVSLWLGKNCGFFNKSIFFTFVTFIFERSLLGLLRLEILLILSNPKYKVCKIEKSPLLLCTVGTFYAPIFSFFRKRVVNIAILNPRLLSNERSGDFTQRVNANCATTNQNYMVYMHCYTKNVLILIIP